MHVFVYIRMHIYKCALTQHSHSCARADLKAVCVCVCVSVSVFLYACMRGYVREHSFTSERSQEGIHELVRMASCGPLGRVFNTKYSLSMQKIFAVLTYECHMEPTIKRQEIHATL
jgi:hypothetical protein